MLYTIDVLVKILKPNTTSIAIKRSLPYLVSLGVDVLLKHDVSIACD